ncbi:MAG: PAS domain S-box protein [Chloroflexales bacterium]|nr:PAS domain S-box protein [Chloroflexales bacterium]
MPLLVISEDASYAATVSRLAPASDIREAQTLASGLALLRTRPFDLLLIDLALGGAGLAACEQALALAPTVPIVALCGPADEELALEAVARGAQDYLVRGRIDGPTLGHVVGCARARQGALGALRSSLAEREASELALRESEARFRSHFELQLIGIAITSLEKGWLQVNDRLCQILGYSRDELVRRTWTEITHPDDVAADVAQFNRVVAGEIEDYSMEKRFIRGDGNMIYADISARCVRNSDGTISYFVGLVQDITQRKLAEAALRESEARFRILFEQAPDAIALTDVAGRCIDVNLAFEELTGRSCRSVRGVPLVELGLVAPSDRPLMREMMPAVVTGGPSRPIDLTIIRPDGARRVIEARFFPISVEGGETLIFSLMHDITHRKRAEENLRQSEERLRLANAELSRTMRLKDEFLASMSHELRTPLGTVLGLAEALGEGVYGSLAERQQRAARDIVQSGTHLLNLINDILDLSKIEADRLEITLQPVLVSEICEASLRMVREQALQKQLSVALAMAPAARVVRADPRRLKQILLNLFSNAVKFTPSGGQIGLEVAADVAARLVRFTVWDTGIGIAPEQISRLFQPFVQLDSDLSRQYSGTGLGLALVRRLADLHGGSVSVQSEPGRGSQFTLTLHSAEDELAGLGAPSLDPQQDSQGDPAADATGAHARILVAEDNQLSQEMLRDYLILNGYRVAEAQDGAQAVEYARAHKPDLILMDIQMPGMDGLEAIKRIRAIPELARVPIIALTALAMVGDRERCLEIGASAYLSKPVELKALRTLISELLATPDSPFRGPGHMSEVGPGPRARRS